LPQVGVDLLDATRGARNARVVDQHVEPAVLCTQFAERPLHLRRIADVARAARGPGVFGDETRDRGRIDVGYVDAGTVPQEAPRDDAADAGGAAGNEDD
jgi:hypothetical protein